MHLERLRQLFDFDLWANRRVLEDIQGAGDSGESVRLFGHILGAQAVWLARLGGRSSAGVAVWPEGKLEDFPAEMERLAAEMRDYLNASTEESITADLTYRLQDGVTEYTNRPVDLLTHLALHGQHHRGQIIWELRKLGQKARSADMIFYLRG
ncbi:MAG: DinB family protein [Bryobacterales bacterium]